MQGRESTHNLSRDCESGPRAGGLCAWTYRRKPRFAEAGGVRERRERFTRQEGKDMPTTVDCGYCPVCRSGRQGLSDAPDNKITAPATGAEAVLLH